MTWHRVEAVAAPAPKAAVLARVAGKEIAVFRDEHGALHALDGSCPHQGGPLAEGIVEAGQVSCPWHGWRFELATGACRMVPGARATRYPVREAGGVLEIEIP